MNRREFLVGGLAFASMAKARPIRSLLGFNRIMSEPPLPFESFCEYVYVGDRGRFIAPIKVSSNLSGIVDFYIPNRQLTSILGLYRSTLSLTQQADVRARYGSVEIVLLSSLASGRFVYEFGNGHIALNDDTYEIPQQDFQGTEYVEIGQCSNNSVLQVRTTYYGIYLTDGDIAVNALPVRLSDGSGGLYDMVGKRLLERTEVGTFTPGPDVEI